MSPRTLTEIRRGPLTRKNSGWHMSVLYLERPEPSPTKLTASELEQAKQQATRYFNHRHCGTR